jgi:hypothetical protein
MTTYRIDFKELANFIESLPDDEKDPNFNHDKEFFYWEDHDGAYYDPLTGFGGIGYPYDPRDEERHVEGYKPPPENLAQFVAEHGAKPLPPLPGEAEPEAIEYDPEAAREIRKVAQEIHSDDGENGPTWQRFIGEQGGDDCMDECGGYLLIQLDMFDEFLKFKYNVPLPDYGSWPTGEKYVP